MPTYNGLYLLSHRRRCKFNFDDLANLDLEEYINIKNVS